jgi:hypothetical protein
MCWSASAAWRFGPGPSTPSARLPSLGPPLRRSACCATPLRRRGDRVLVRGANGGVGVAAIQIAKVMGAHVTALVSTTDQIAQAEAIGAHVASVPQVGTTDVAQGGVAVIDPSSMSVVALYPAQNCTPAGMALGPYDQALLGCSASFGTSPNILTQSVVFNIKTGNVVATIPQVGGSDEVWYDRASNHYYLGARSNETNTGVVTPVLGTIDAGSNVWDGNTPTSTSAHSVAADKVSHHVFVPIGFPAAGASDPTNPCPVVSKGCIAVYLPSSIDGDDHLRTAKK